MASKQMIGHTRIQSIGGGRVRPITLALCNCAGRGPVLPLARGRRQPHDMVQAAQAGAGGGGCGLCTRHLRAGGSLRSGVDARPRPMRGARTRDHYPSKLPHSADGAVAMVLMTYGDAQITLRHYIRTKPRLWTRDTACTRLSTVSFRKMRFHRLRTDAQRSPCWIGPDRYAQEYSARGSRRRRYLCWN